jgi:hypothetical protein
MNDHKKVIEAYDKIRAIIKTSVTDEHFKIVQNMIDNLTVVCLGEKLPYDYYILYVNNLRIELKEKIKSFIKND